MTKEDWIKELEAVKVEWNTLDKAYWKLRGIADKYYKETDTEDLFESLFEEYIDEDGLNVEVQWRAEHDGWGAVWYYLRPIQASSFTVFRSDGYTVRNIYEDDIDWLKEEMIKVINNVEQEKVND